MTALPLAEINEAELSSAPSTRMTFDGSYPQVSFNTREYIMALFAPLACIDVIPVPSRRKFMGGNDIPPHLLHKDSVDDVLICSPRVALPLYLEEPERHIAETIGSIDLLRKYVSVAGKWRIFQTDFCDAGSSIDWGAMAGKLLMEEDLDRVRAIPYQIVESFFLGNSSGAGNNGMRLYPDADRLFDLVPSAQRSSSYLFLNNASHYFFYRKTHEHVPGMMLIEAQRQAVYHHLYSSTNHVRGKITVSWNQVDAQFYAHAELMYPIELVVDDMERASAEFPKKIHYRVSFYQRRRMLAVITTKASVIKLDRFEKLRNIFLDANDWYSPINETYVECVLSTTSGQKHTVSLVRIAKDGCVTESPDIEPQLIKSATVSNTDGLSFAVNVNYIGSEDGKIFWKFVDTMNEEITAIGNIVKRGFVVCNQ